MKHSIKILLFICFSCLVIYNIGYAKFNYEIYYKGWEYYDNNEYNKASKIAKKYYNSTRDSYKMFGGVLLSAIYTDLESYQKSLKIIKKIRPTLTKSYNDLIMHQNEVNKDVKKFIEFLYYKMVYSAARTNFNLENWKSALDNFLEYKKNNDSHKAFCNERIAACYYMLGNFSKSIQYLKKNYHLDENRLFLRHQSAFNIAANYAMLNQTKKAIKWLEIPLYHNATKWLNSLKDEKDFNRIRKNEKFKSFVQNVQKNASKFNKGYENPKKKKEDLMIQE